ncbi:cytosolic sulfotransferase 12-like [Salvia miltiorrhiza]|uniref:cytosolic sulfotransferase 12-like n=1 Tax=Salvia miltiorrhiza TaxID=226208 RepID=UPI0025AC1C71|nr:cytosolic sulfotransferase 12-like [Salvia miltiorrhiza]
MQIKPKMPSETSPATPEYLQQEESVGEEVNELISRLPKEKGWLTAHLYQYQGFWYPVRHLAGVLACQKHFLSEDNDIFLVSTPKSGTTWLKAIVFALVNRSRFPTKPHPLTASNPHDLVPFLEINHYVDGRIPDLSSSPSPRLFSTHLPLLSLPESVGRSHACKIVYLCRNPKDIFVSLWHFTNGLKPLHSPPNSMADVVDMFLRGVSLFGPCWDHALHYWNLCKEDSGRVMFVRFEEMKERPKAQLRRLSEFLGCPFSAAEEEAGAVEEILRLCSFENLSDLEVNRSGRLSSGEENRVFFRRGVVGDWRNYLDDETAARFDRIAEEKFRGSGLVL